MPVISAYCSLSLPRGRLCKSSVQLCRDFISTFPTGNPCPDAFIEALGVAPCLSQVQSSPLDVADGMSVGRCNSLCTPTGACTLLSGSVPRRP